MSASNSIVPVPPVAAPTLVDGHASAATGAAPHASTTVQGTVAQILGTLSEGVLLEVLLASGRVPVPSPKPLPTGTVVLLERAADGPYPWHLRGVVTPEAAATSTTRSASPSVAALLDDAGLDVPRPVVDHVQRLVEELRLPRERVVRVASELLRRELPVTTALVRGGAAPEPTVREVATALDRLAGVIASFEDGPATQEWRAALRLALGLESAGRDALAGLDRAGIERPPSLTSPSVEAQPEGQIATSEPPVWTRARPAMVERLLERVLASLAERDPVLAAIRRVRQELVRSPGSEPPDAKTAGHSVYSELEPRARAEVARALDQLERDQFEKRPQLSEFRAAARTLKEWSDSAIYHQWLELGSAADEPSTAVSGVWTVDREPHAFRIRVRDQRRGQKGLRFELRVESPRLGVVHATGALEEAREHRDSGSEIGPERFLDLRLAAERDDVREAIVEDESELTEGLVDRGYRPQVSVGSLPPSSESRDVEAAAFSSERHRHGLDRRA